MGLQLIRHRKQNGNSQARRETPGWGTLELFAVAMKSDDEMAMRFEQSMNFSCNVSLIV
jgi:hypothetical protein